MDTRSDPLRTYPAGDVAANLIGFIGDEGKPMAGLELNFDKLLAGKDGKETYEVGGGNRIPLGDNSQVKPVDGKDLQLTIDRDVQWYSQRVLRAGGAVDHRRSRAPRWCSTPGPASCWPSPTTRPSTPTSPASRPRSISAASSLSDVYEPGSVEKVLTAAACSTRARSPRGRGSRCPPSCRSSTARSATGSTTA